MRERWRDYELMFIISPLHSAEEEVAAVVQRVQQTIEAEGGAVTAVNHSSPWGRRKLAYPIRAYAGGEASRRSFSEGYYVLLHFTIGASRLAEVERTMKLSDAILRYLVTLVERKEQRAEFVDTQDEEELARVPASGSEEDEEDYEDTDVEEE